MLKIPVRTNYARKYKKRYKRTIKTRKYVVRRGDTLWEIARRFNVSVSALRRINRLGSNCLYIGQVLAIPSNG